MLYRIPTVEIGGSAARVITNWTSLSVLLSLYLITLLQRILESRSQIKLAQRDLNGIFHNRRVNTAGASLFIGLLPSVASMILCSEIVKDATDGYLEPKEQAFTASWFRHIPESVLPTYTAVLLMLSLSGVEISQFVAGMIIPVTTLAFNICHSMKKICREARVDQGCRGCSALNMGMWGSEAVWSFEFIKISFPTHFHNV